MHKQIVCLSVSLLVSGIAFSYTSKAEATVTQPPVYACAPGLKCAYLMERVNIFMRDPASYCQRKYGRDAFVHRIWFVVPFCALPYNPKNYV